MANRRGAPRPIAMHESAGRCRRSALFAVTHSTQQESFRRAHSVPRRNSSGPDLRGDWGVETKAGACERPLDGLQPRATLDYHENNRPATFDSASPAARRPERCKDVAGPRHMAREGECGTSRTESEERRSMRLIPDTVLKGLVLDQFDQSQTLRSGPRGQKNR